jgi:hypothetical protein
MARLYIEIESDYQYQKSLGAPSEQADPKNHQ